MDTYKIITDKFEGPLELLMHLINKEEFDIYDIPISSITEQYIKYISSMQQFNIEIASEFLLMAATLLQIKSRMLLPKQVITTDENDGSVEVDPRQELIDRLRIYKKFKFLGEVFLNIFNENKKYFVREPEYFAVMQKLPENLGLDNLLLALAEFIEPEENIQSYIQHDEYSVQDKMDDILNLLRIQTNNITLRDTLLHSGSRDELISSFLAVLELLRIKKIKVIQKEQFGSIYLSIREGADVF